MVDTKRLSPLLHPAGASRYLAWAAQELLLKCCASRPAVRHAPGMRVLLPGPRAFGLLSSLLPPSVAIPATWQPAPTRCGRAGSGSAVHLGIPHTSFAAERGAAVRQASGGMLVGFVCTPVGALQVGRKEQWMCAAASFPLVYLHRVDCKGHLLHIFVCCPGWFRAPLTCCAISCTELAWQPPACLRVALMPTAGDCVRWGMVLACVWSWRLDGQPGCLWLLAQQPCEWVASRCETARDAMSEPCAPSSQDCHSSAPASKAAGKQARPLPCALLAHTRRHTLVWCLPAKPSLGHVAAWERGCAGRVGHGTPCCIEPPS